jgi:hypothetical protein
MGDKEEPREQVEEAIQEVVTTGEERTVRWSDWPDVRTVDIVRWINEAVAPVRWWQDRDAIVIELRKPSGL